MILCFGLSYSQTKTSSLSWRLLAETEGSKGLESDGADKLEFIISPDVTWKIKDGMKLYVQGRFYSEYLDNLEIGEAGISNYSSISKPFVIDDYSQFELRELYVDSKLGETYLRLGKQQIVWGQTEGIKVLDVINPMSWREFVFDDFDDSRIPLWSAKSDFKIQQVKFQAIWIPDMTYHQLSNGNFNQNPPLPVIDNTEVIINETDKPNRFIQDSDFAFKMSAMIGNWDLSLNYIYQFDDVPVVNKRVSFFNNTYQLDIEPSYRRNNLIGTSFNTTFGNFGFRGEVGVYPNRAITSNQLDGEIKKVAQVSSGIGLDYFGLDQTIVTIQWFSDELFKSNINEIIDRSKRLDYFSLMINRSFFNQRLAGKLFTIYGIKGSDGFVETKFNYQLKDNLQINFTSDIMFGDDDSIIGQFNNSDRLMIGFEYGIQSR